MKKEVPLEDTDLGHCLSGDNAVGSPGVYSDPLLDSDPDLAFSLGPDSLALVGGVQAEVIQTSPR